MSVGLTLEDVEHHVFCLPSIVVEHLALGPIEPMALLDVEGEVTDETATRLFTPCRVCEALGEGGRNLPKSAHERDRMHAQELWAWHECGAVDLLDFAEAAGVELDDDEDREPSRLLAEILGALSYARCCTIYAAARHASGRS